MGVQGLFWAVLLAVQPLLLLPGLHRGHRAASKHKDNSRQRRRQEVSPHLREPDFEGALELS